MRNPIEKFHLTHDSENRNNHFNQLIIENDVQINEIVRITIQQLGQSIRKM